MGKEQSPNQKRKSAGEEQVGRRVGTSKIKRAIRKEQYNRLMEYACKNTDMRHETKKKFKIACTLLYCAGFRVSEIIAITDKDLQQIIKHKHYSTANNTKMGSSRFVLFDDRHIKLLEQYRSSTSGYLFKKNNTLGHMTVEGLSKLLNKYIQIVLGELYSTHGFRRNLASLLLAETKREKLVMQHMGWKVNARSTVTVYDVVEDGEIEAALSRIDI